MSSEIEITENLRDAGCGEEDVESILACYKSGDRKKVEQLIAKCRKKQLNRMHDSQRCIDRLDYLIYRLNSEVKI